MSIRTDYRVVIAFLPDRVSYLVERAGDPFVSRGIMRPSPDSLSGRGLKFDFLSVGLAPDADLQASLIHGSLDLQSRLARTPDFMGAAAEPAIRAFLQSLMGSVFRSNGDCQVEVSAVDVALSN